MTGRYLPYGRQCIDADDIEAVAEVLRGDWLTTGPKIPAFEAALGEATGAPHVVNRLRKAVRGQMGGEAGGEHQLVLGAWFILGPTSPE